MQSFLVLGLVPGTNIQINFALWVGFIVSLLSLFWLVRLAPKRHAIRAYFIARKVARLIDRYQLAA